jgi:hypothetical protein
MNLNKKRVISAADLTPGEDYPVQKGDYGYAVNLLLQEGVIKYSMPSKLEGIDPSSEYPFKVNNNSYRYFLPAPYEACQKAWLRDNKVKVGDRVKIIQDLKSPEVVVDKIDSDGIWVKIKDGYGVAFRMVPYFCLEKLEVPEYRKYTSGEMKSLVGQVIERKEHAILNSAGDRFVVVGFFPHAVEGKEMISILTEHGMCRYNSLQLSELFERVNSEGNKSPCRVLIEETLPFGGMIRVPFQDGYFPTPLGDNK